MKYKLFATSLIAAAIWSNTAKADEQACLIEAVYFEARSESFMAQLAVANVIIERVKRDSYPKTICGVVRQGVYRNGKPVRHKCMFSYYCDGKPEVIANTKAYEISSSVASLAMQGVIVSNTDGATHYHASYVQPYWSLDSNFIMLGQVGQHIFYIDTLQRGVYNEHNK
jgi:spore germination cell wall hydrolase CwlJ-like protein